jgi:phospholipase/carboxylesterase
MKSWMAGPSPAMTAPFPWLTNMMSNLSFIHRYEPGDAPPLLLLHGTGGDENDLVPLGHLVAPGKALISPRGKVLEGGMPRFFRRLAMGVFDEEDVIRRAHELADFVGEARVAYGFQAPVALGLSNGANIAAAMLLLRPEVLAGAALLRPMLPLREPAPAKLEGKPVLILAGAMDPIADAAQASGLTALFKKAGAAVHSETVPAGHGLSQADVTFAKAWLRTKFPGA